tara:strand:- start:5509 stop:7983 length:2475 start_codon:yes stop_codon:yes gene_type:complete
MAKRNEDGSFTPQSELGFGDKLGQIFGAVNYTNPKESRNASELEVQEMMFATVDADRAAEEMFQEYQKTGVDPQGYRSNITGMSFGDWYKGYQERKKDGTVDFMKDVAPVLSDNLLDKRHPDMFKEVLKQSGNEDFKRVSVSDLLNSGQVIDGKTYFDPRVITMEPGEGGTFKVRENAVTADGVNERDGGQSLDGLITADSITAAYDVKVANLESMSPGSALGRNLINKLRSLDLDPSDLVNLYQNAANPNVSRERTLEIIDKIGATYSEAERKRAEEANAVSINTLGAGTDSVTQQWRQISEGTKKYEEAFSKFMESGQVIEVDPNKFSKKGFLVDGENLKGAALIENLKKAKGYLTGELSRPASLQSPYDIATGLSVFGASADNTALTATQYAQKPDRVRKELLGKDFTINDIESLFTEAQWNSLSEPEKKEAFALIGEMSTKNISTLVETKLAEIQPGGAGLDTEQARTVIKNNRNYREFFNTGTNLKNINAMFKDPEIKADFESLSPQEFATKYSVDGKLDTKRLVGNNLSNAAKATLNDVISKDNLKEFKVLAENNDIEGIKKLVSTINISEKQQALLTKELTDTAGDLRQLSITEKNRDLAQQYIMAALATARPDAPIYGFLKDISIGEYATTGLFNSKGAANAKDAASIEASLRSSIPESEFSQPFSDAYSELKDINKEYRTGKLENPEMKWQESTKALSNMKAQMGLGNAAQQLAMRTAYAQEVINSLKEFVASVKPNLWEEITTLTFAEGGQFKLFGNQVDAIAERNENGKIIGLRIGDTVTTINEMTGQFSPEFINALVAAGDRANRKQPAKNR